MSLNIFGYLRPSQWSNHVKGLATVAPLMSGVIAPFSVLLDIPALSEKWYSKNGTPAPDPLASLVLSGLSLSFGVIANALLIIRFSTTNFYLRRNWIIPFSIVCWTVKVVVGVVNLIVFGITTRNEPNYSFIEGFWCAVVSTITSSLVLLLLSVHSIANRKKDKDIKPEDERRVHRQVRVSGRHFMLSTTILLALIALMALIMSKVEGWSYLDGIYFSTVTVETIGFGDFSPTKAVTRALLAPLTILGIAYLGSLVQMIVDFFSKRSATRKERSRAMFERERQEAEDKAQNPANLVAEIEFLDKLNQGQDLKDQAWEFAMSFAGFIAFWLIGGAIFMALEGWTFGTSMYFCYVFFLTIGYGDFSPTTPAGKVVFIVYSLMAVPVMASFAVSTVSQVMTRLSEWRLQEQRTKQGVDPTSEMDDEVIVEHAEYLAQAHERLDHLSSQSDQASSSHESGTTAKPSPNAEKDTEIVQDANERLVREVISRAMAMEAHARRLLIRHLPNGSRAQVLLKADRNLQLRDLRFLRQSKGGSKKENELARHGRSLGKKEEEKTLGPDKLGQGNDSDDEEDADWVSEPLTDEDTLEEVRRYRESFANLLVAGTRLQKLEGQEMYMLERRRPQKEI